jgi:hypothetical protein
MGWLEIAVSVLVTCVLLISTTVVGSYALSTVAIVFATLIWAFSVICMLLMVGAMTVIGSLVAISVVCAVIYCIAHAIWRGIQHLYRLIMRRQSIDL